MATDPNWKANIMEAMRERRRRNGRPNSVFGRELRPLQLTGTLKYLRFIDAAAKDLNVNRSTFIRRAAAVVAANILDIDVRTILWESPRPGGYGEQRMRVDSAGVRDDGTGIEAWCPHRGCDGSHFHSSEG